MNLQGNNRLPMLADEARQAHVDSARHTTQAAERALAAGAALAEAKALCKHGQWGEWLAETGIPERSAQRYMKMHRSGLKTATVADLGGIAGADRFIAWHRGEGLHKWPAQDVAETLIEGRRMRDLTPTQLREEIETRIAEDTRERLCNCNPDRVLRDDRGRVLARVEGAGFYDPLELVEGV
ncbi:DUF3102 domain-containing protein [Sediminimonas sp.]|uniref:DUF3102 domain-containing protein n=1 Tax=Sediminimonas sp. TaxID=2823379 RepID=UPI0025CD6914|nr:DUF3102 domain-containing protein [Sediminimonas sp.]